VSSVCPQDTLHPAPHFFQVRLHFVRRLERGPMIADAHDGQYTTCMRAYGWMREFCGHILRGRKSVCVGGKRYTKGNEQ
jgi:hypothetical protein